MWEILETVNGLWFILFTTGLLLVWWIGVKLNVW